MFGWGRTKGVLMNRGRQFKLVTITVLLALLPSAAARRLVSRHGKGNSAVKHRREALAPPPSRRSCRPIIRLRLSPLTVVRGAFLCRLVSFSQSAAARPLSRAGEYSSNPMPRFSRQSSNVLASRRGRSWQSGEWRRVSEVNAIIARDMDIDAEPANDEHPR
jgi:hypothetical protein